MTNELNKRYHYSNSSEKDYGVRVFMGIGGSATNDGGLGALQALGLDIYVDNTNEEGRRNDNKKNKKDEKKTDEELLRRPFTGKDLAHITRV